jgi:hypothetical protein
MFTEYFPVFPSKTRIAIVSFSTYVRKEFDFNEHKNKECLRRGIREMRWGIWNINKKYARLIYRVIQERKFHKI